MSTPDPFDFLASVKAGDRDEPSTIRLATVASSTATGFTVTFDGEGSATQKKYLHAGASPPAVGDRVALAMAGSSAIILGTVKPNLAPGSFTNLTATDQGTAAAAAVRVGGQAGFGLYGGLTFTALTAFGAWKLAAYETHVTIRPSLTVEGDVTVPNGDLTGGIKLADVTLASDGELNLTNLGGLPFYKVFVQAGDNSSDSIGANNLSMRWNNSAVSGGYRWNFTDLGVSLGMTDTANYIPVARTSQGANRTIAEVTIANTGSWPTALCRGFGNWGTTGSRHTLTGAVRASAITVTSIQFGVHNANDLAAGARAIVYGYR